MASSSCIRPVSWPRVQGEAAAVRWWTKATFSRSAPMIFDRSLAGLAPVGGSVLTAGFWKRRASMFFQVFWSRSFSSAAEHLPRSA